MLIPDQTPFLQQIQETFLKENQINLYLKREDLIHPIVSGNKWRKLKYNLIEAKTLGYSKILTFGGAYSNHIHAMAAAAKETGFEAIGIIRGEETLPLNDTLQFAVNHGMTLKYVDRSEYRQKDEPLFLEQLKATFGDFYLIPEGGSNAMAVKGCAEISKDIEISYDIICSSVGTGGTLAGLITSHVRDTQIIGFSALKGQDFLEKDVQKLLSNSQTKNNERWEINYEYHFGGYAKIKPELLEFIRSFYQQNGVVLDPIYTGKMMYGLYDMISKGVFPKKTTIVALHTGGLQGIKGIEERYDVTLPK